MRIEETLIKELRAAQSEIVHGMLKFPAAELMKHYLEVGRHQGLEQALEILAGVMSGHEDE